MRRVCEICGTAEPNLLDKLTGASLPVRINECEKCCLLFCSECGLLPDVDGVARTHGPLAAASAVCPMCNSSRRREDRG